MDKLVIIGGGGHARVLASVVSMRQQFTVAGYTDLHAGNMGEFTYLGDDSILTDLFQTQGVRHAALGIGSLGATGKRRMIFTMLREIGFILPPILAASVVMHPDVQMGQGTVVFDGVVINPNTRIGAGVILNTHATIEHDCDIGDFVHVSPGATLAGDVTIGSNSHIGIGATIIQGVHIGDDCFIAAGSVVTRDCTTPGTYKGIPARLDAAGRATS